MTEQPPSDPKAPLVHRMVSTAMLTFGVILPSVAALILYQQLTERPADGGWNSTRSPRPPKRRTSQDQADARNRK
jgi:hypothetical protein